MLRCLLALFSYFYSDCHGHAVGFHVQLLHKMLKNWAEKELSFIFAVLVLLPIPFTCSLPGVKIRSLKAFFLIQAGTV